MAQQRTTRHGPFTSKPEPTVSFKVIDHWGTQLGDETEYRLSRTGNSIRIYGPHVDLTLRMDTAESFHIALGNLLEDFDHIKREGEGNATNG